jgi:hypothetical protein
MSVLHRNLALLRVSEPGVLDEVRAVVPLDEYVLGSLSATEILVDPQRLKGLLDLLEARGMSALVKRVGP